MKLSLIVFLVATVAAWGHTSAAADEVIHYNLQDQIRHREMIYAALRKIYQLPRREQLQAKAELKVVLIRMQKAYARSEKEQKRIRLQQNSRRGRFSAHHGY